MKLKQISENFLPQNILSNTELSSRKSYSPIDAIFCTKAYIILTDTNNFIACSLLDLLRAFNFIDHTQLDPNKNIMFLNLL